MSKNMKIVAIVISILLVISLIVLGIVLKNSNDLNSNYEGEGIDNFYGHNKFFYAEITKVSDKYILVDGTDINGINYQGEFELSISKSTKIIKDEQEIKVGDLKVGDYVEIEFYGNIAESYPAKIKDVSQIRLYTEQEYKEKESEFNEKLSSIESFYNNDIIANYKKVTELDVSYSVNDAKEENCFVQIHQESYNKNLYEEFLQKYKNNESAFIRIASCTIEGHTIIHDVKYDNETGKVTVIRDLTRDKYSNYLERTITITEYENIIEYNYQGTICLVAYNGEINDEKFSTGELMTIVIIN